MKITFLGTGASEGIPSMFCSCRVCENARRVGGKEVRSRSGVLINDDLMIDFSSDALLNAVRHGVRYTNVKNVLITHSHSDHLSLEDVLPKRAPQYAGEYKPLNIYSNSVVLSQIEATHPRAVMNGKLILNELVIGSTVDVGDYKVTPFRSIHIEKEESMVFLIEKDDKRYLHLYDTGRVILDVFLYLKANEITIDCAVLDCTYALSKEEYFGHMNLNQIAQACKEFREKGIFNDQTQIYASHICHWNATHEELCEEAKKYGIKVAYDGLQIVI